MPPAASRMVGASGRAASRLAFALLVPLAAALAVDAPAFTDADWHSFGEADGTVFSLSGASGDLLAGGAFTQLGGAALPYVGRWNGQAWSPLGSGPGYGVSALARDGATIYALWGDSRRISRWNGTAWTQIGLANATIYDLAVMGGKLYASGFTDFIQVSGVAVQRIACWDGTTWAPVGGGVNDTITNMSASGSTVYISGTFTTAGGIPATARIASWDGSVWTGYPAGSGVSPGSAVLAAGGELYAGGDVVARWTGSAWAVLGTPDARVRAMAMHGGNLYVGGSFTRIDGVAANRIAVWNGSVWSAIGSGTDAEVRWMAVTGGNLAVAGEFSTAGGIAAEHLALLDLDGDSGAPAAPVDADPSAGALHPRPVGATLGITARAADPDQTPVVYRLSDDAGGRVAIDARSGVVTAAQALSFGTYTIGIQADDRLHASTASSFTIQIDDPPAAPGDSDATVNQIVENAVAGRSVGLTAAATDPNGTTVTYSLSDDAGGRFAIDTVTGVVTVAGPLGSPASRVITVAASDGMLSTSASFTIAVTANRAPSVPVDTNGEADAVSASAPIGTSIRLTASSVDPDGSTMAYSLSDAAGGRFAIDAASGVVTVAAALGDPGMQSITIVASDGGLAATASFAIAVVNQTPAAPVDADSAVDAVTTAAGAGATVGIIVRSIDADPGAVLTYRLSDSAGGLFAIDPSTGVVTVAGALGAAATRRITVEVTDGWASASASFDIVVATPRPGGGNDDDGCGVGAIGAVGFAIAAAIGRRRSRR